MHERALATPAGADNGNLLTGCDGQVQVIQHRLVGVGKGQVPYLDAHRCVPGERVTGCRVLGLVGACQQLIEAVERTASGIVGILQVQQLLDRADHEPEVAEDGKHLADRQVREQHRQHGRCAEDVDAELEQQSAGAAAGVALPLRFHGVVAHLARLDAQSTEEIALAVTGADLLDGIERFG